MKKYVSFLNLCSLIIIFSLISVVFVSASEVNSIPANVGDTVTYELHVNPCPDKIQALDVSIYYDSTALELIPYSLELPNISGFMTNTDILGEVRFNAIDFDGFSFESDKILSTVQFKVINTTSENLKLSYEIKRFLNSDEYDLKDTYIYDVSSVNGRTEENSQDSSSSEITSDNTQRDTQSDTMAYNSRNSINSNSYVSNLSSDRKTDFNSNTYNKYNDVDNVENINISLDSDSDLINSDAEPLKPEADNRHNNLKLYIIVTVIAFIIILLIGYIFSIFAKRSNNDNQV